MSLFALQMLAATRYGFDKPVPRKIHLPRTVHPSTYLFGAVTIETKVRTTMTFDVAETLIAAAVGPLPTNIDYDVFAARAESLQQAGKVYAWHESWKVEEAFATMFAGLDGLHQSTVRMSAAQAANFYFAHSQETRKAFFERGIKPGEQVYLSAVHPLTGFKHEFIATSTYLGLSVVQRFIDGQNKVHYSEHCDGDLPGSNLCCFDGLAPGEDIEERILNIVGGASGEPNVHERIQILWNAIGLK